MARQIVILSATKVGSDFHVTAVFWLATPANLVVPNPNATSAVPPVAVVAWGITSAELAAIQAGTVTEQLFDSGLFASTRSLAQDEAALVALYTAAQAALNATAPGAKVIGAYYDGSAWTLPL